MREQQTTVCRDMALFCLIAIYTVSEWQLLTSPVKKFSPWRRRQNVTSKGCYILPDYTASYRRKQQSLL